MLKPFPKDFEEKKQLASQLRAAAPELMADINTLRTQFPTSRLTYVKAGDMEYGETGTNVWPISDELCERVREKTTAVERAVAAEAARKLALSTQRRKSKKARK